MRQETFTLSQKELQRVSVISACIKGDMACARAAGLLCLSVRQIKRLKKRMREEGEAALAHANRGRPSRRRLPQAVRERTPPLCPAASPKPPRMAPSSGKSRTHLLLRARTHRQQRQRRAMGGPPLPDPPAGTPFQLRRSQSADLPSSRWARLALLRPDPLDTLSTTRGVTVLCCC